MAKILIWIYGLIIIVSVISYSAFAAQLKPEDVWAHIESKGGRSALHTYFECADIHGDASGYGLVATGNEEWLKVAVRLLHDSYACFSENLEDAIGRAMLNAPEHVLPLVDTLSAKICLPFMSDETPDQENLGFLDRLERVLQRVKLPELQHSKNVCLAKINKVRSLIRNNPSPYGASSK